MHASPHVPPAPPRPTCLTYDRLATPLGELLLAYEDGVLAHVDFGDDPARCARVLAARYGAYTLAPRRAADGGPHPACRALARYMAGDLGALRDVAVTTGGTATQRRVWEALRDIPAGSTESYGRFAERVGLARGARAVGRINGQNPVAVVLPCHRVVGADGSLTGFGGGVHRKRWLLEHEGALARGLGL